MYKKDINAALNITRELKPMAIEKYNPIKNE
jgi:hypothetical protein